MLFVQVSGRARRGPCPAAGAPVRQRKSCSSAYSSAPCRRSPESGFRVVSRHPPSVAQEWPGCAGPTQRDPRPDGRRFSITPGEHDRYGHSSHQLRSVTVGRQPRSGPGFRYRPGHRHGRRFQRDVVDPRSPGDCPLAGAAVHGCSLWAGGAWPSGSALRSGEIIEQPLPAGVIRRLSATPVDNSRQTRPGYFRVAARRARADRVQAGRQTMRGRQRLPCCAIWSALYIRHAVALPRRPESYFFITRHRTATAKILGELLTALTLRGNLREMAFGDARHVTTETLVPRTSRRRCHSA